MIQMSLKFMPKYPINHKTSLVHVMTDMREAIT